MSKWAYFYNNEDSYGIVDADKHPDRDDTIIHVTHDMYSEIINLSPEDCQLIVDRHNALAAMACLHRTQVGYVAMAQGLMEPTGEGLPGGLMNCIRVCADCGQLVGLAK